MCQHTASGYTESVLAGGQKERVSFVDARRAGGSRHPYDLFLDAGLDVASPETCAALIRRMDQLLDDFETTLDRVESQNQI